MSRLLIPALVWLLCIPTHVWGQDAPPNKQPIAFRPPLTTTVQRTLDADGDGILSAEEIETAFVALSSLDRNQSGDLSIVEIGGPGPITGMLRLQPLIRVLDRDGDIKISAFELEQASRSLKKLDRDGDNQVSAAELSYEKSLDPDYDEIHRRTKILLGEYFDQITGAIPPGANTETAEGYLLIHETSNHNDVQMGKHTYLLNNEGNIVQGWFNKRFSPETSSAKLLESGLLWRTVSDLDWIERENYPHGAHGTIELLDFNGNVLWNYTLEKQGSYVMHHDFEPLPNGNVMITAYIAFTLEEAADIGFDTSLANGELVWFDSIIELAPDLDTQTASLVWQWNSWDHVVQDKFPGKPNYGEIAENPHRIDLNAIDLKSLPFNHGEIHHVNALSYHAGLDLILLSSAATGEIWVIDHSTTREEAETDQGGAYGKGGRLVYRWGNPGMVASTNQSRTLFWPQDAQWVAPDSTDSSVLLFNTGHRRNALGKFDPEQANLGIGEAYSDLVEFTIPLDQGIYTETANPETTWTWNAEGAEEFYAPFSGGVKRLENGNTLLVQAHTKRVIELTPEGTRVLDFRIPGPGRIFTIDKINSIAPGVFESGQ